MGVPRNIQRTKCAEKHDRLGWAAGSAFRWNQLTIGLRTNEPAVLPRLERFVPKSAVKIEATEVEILLSLRVGQAARRRGQTNYHLVYHAWERAVRTLDLEEAILGFHQLLTERCALHCPEPLYMRGSLWSSEVGAIALHGPLPQAVQGRGADLDGYVSLGSDAPADLVAIVLYCEGFSEATGLTAGQATVRALSLSLAPYFLADAGSCLYRMGEYFSKAPVYGVPADFPLDSLKNLLGQREKENHVAGKI